ncbi:hypothetical protein RclHR1_04340001 [Rhizophagus clarus]|uniref:Uncharacterized protein n=1 Tax=Rhizophagus clarus TaxID=94130 RepID=A0A2Z6RI35_9GLOM|nr:hypothetical protein RclHR1_04340001 [Rhizophagus clarus]GES95500.1 hypothetical protein GLOIN_2v1779530 [Rhizophagus clarus]
MSLKSNETRTYGAPYQVHKINLNNDNRRFRRKPPKYCPDCKETDDCIKTFSNKVNRIEEVVNDFHKKCSKNKIEKCSIFNAKFTLNNVPCELEYDLSEFSLDNLQKLAISTTQNFNNFSNKNN